MLGQPEFAPPLAIPTAEYRERVLAWMQTIADEGLTAPGFPAEFGGQDDPGANIAGFETIALGDLSLLVKFGVQFGLWGGAIQQLGTRVHHERYLRPTASLELTGCFAMTETGHGSNVQQLGTTATYDPDAGEFVIDTPTDEARKDYIGNAACHARMAAVFAQLIVAGESHGVHVLVVPIRDENGNVHEGVRIEDCGEKMGLNGVDNGRIWFDHVRVPRDALLNRYGGVNAAGRLREPDRESEQALLHDARRADPGTRVHLRGVDQRGQDRADDRGALRPAANAVRSAGRGPRSRCSTTAPTSAG